MIELEQILHNHGLKNTPFRKNLLAMLYKVNSSLTAEEIKNRIIYNKNKATIYRALEAFEKSGLIHTVPDVNNLTRYAICHGECNEHRHVHDHAHFICENCKETFCIDQIEIPLIKENMGFIIKHSTLTLEGECPDCSR